MSSTTSTIRASVLFGPLDLREDQRQLDPPGADEIQVAIKATGLCGSDLHFYREARIGSVHMTEPLILGHESAGVVTAVGSEASSFKVGDRVALEVGKPCDVCSLCREGRYNICPEMRFRATARWKPHVQGTLQERINHPAKWAYKLPDSMPLEYGALAEPLSVAMHARDRGNLPENSKVLVIGAGAVGLLCAAISRVSKAHSIVIADINEGRVNFAVSNGFADAGVVVPLKPAHNEGEKLAAARELAELIKKTKVNGEEFGEAKGTYECTGVESSTQAAIYATHAGGKVMIVGMGSSTQVLPISVAAMREVDLIGVFRYSNTYRKVIDLLAGNEPLLPPLNKLITHRFTGINQIPQAFEIACKTRDEDGKLILKVVVDM